MDRNVLRVREIQEKDIEAITKYWLNSESTFLESMGVDVNKLPSREQLIQALLSQLTTPVEQKKAYCTIWELDEKPIGHSNTNPTTFGEEAFLHLHIWDASIRKKGFGVELLKRTLPYYFDNLQVKRLYSEPYALNPAPSRTLERAGFELVKEYTTIPGSLNFEQPVKRWMLTRERFRELYR